VRCVGVCHTPSPSRHKRSKRWSDLAPTRKWKLIAFCGGDVSLAAVVLLYGDRQCTGFCGRVISGGRLR
jgi:hypothetical protein